MKIRNNIALSRASPIRGLDCCSNQENNMSEVNNASTEQHNMSQESNTTTTMSQKSSDRRFIVPMFILVLGNLVLYMDRFSIAAILVPIQNEFAIGDQGGGFIQTTYIFFYMISAPFFGYLGDRYSRRAILVLAGFAWIIFATAGSFAPAYGWFLASRWLVGVFQASFSTVAFSIISDWFRSEHERKFALMFFCAAVPVGSGLGYLATKFVTDLAQGDFRWGLRVMPILGLLTTFLTLIFIQDPDREEEASTNESDANESNCVSMTRLERKSTFFEDLKYLYSKKSYLYSMLATDFVVGCAGALAWWGPKFTLAAVAVTENVGVVTAQNSALVFGGTTVISGFIGMALGLVLSKMLPKIDAYICIIGLILSSVLLTVAIMIADLSPDWAFLPLFLGMAALNTHWAIVSNMHLTVIESGRRSIARALQIFTSHLLGDLYSPYLIGFFSELWKDRLGSSCWNLPVEAVTDITLQANSTNEVVTNRDLIRTIDMLVNWSLPASTTDTLEHTTVPLGLEAMWANYSQVSCQVNVTFHSLQYSLLSTIGFILLGVFFFILTAKHYGREKPAETSPKVDDTESGAKVPADNLESQCKAATGNNNGLSCTEDIPESQIVVLESALMLPNCSTEK